MIIRKYNKKYKKDLNNPKNVWFIWFYRDTCMFCEPIHPIWDELEKYVKKNKIIINLAKIESKYISEDMLGFNPNITSVPTFMVRYYNKKNSFINQIKDSRDLESFIKIVKKYESK